MQNGIQQHTQTSRMIHRNTYRITHKMIHRRTHKHMDLRALTHTYRRTSIRILCSWILYKWTSFSYPSERIHFSMFCMASSFCGETLCILYIHFVSLASFACIYPEFELYLVLHYISFWAQIILCVSENCLSTFKYIYISVPLWSTVYFSECTCMLPYVHTHAFFIINRWEGAKQFESMYIYQVWSCNVVSNSGLSDDFMK